VVGVRIAGRRCLAGSGSAGPEEMLGSGRDREAGWGRLLRPLVLVAALAAGGVGLVACGSGTRVPRPVRSTSASALSGTASTMGVTTTRGVTTTTESRDEVVLEAWKRDVLAVYRAEAARPPAYNSPQLGRYLVNPNLDFVRKTLLSFKLRGWAGPRRYEVWPVRVNSLKKTIAIVEGCSWDAGVRMASGQASPPPYGQSGFTSYRATLIADPNRPASWRIMSSTGGPSTDKAGPCKGLHAPS